MRRLFLVPLGLALCVTITCILGPKDGNESNQAPTFSGGLPATGTVGTQITATLHAKDMDGDALSFDLLQGPSGMTLSDSVLSWTPSISDTGSNPVSVQVSDGKNEYDTLDGTIMVADSNHAPIFAVKSAYDTISVRGTYRDTIELASDQNGDSIGYSVLSPSGASVTAGGVVAWTVSASDSGEKVILIQASDGRGKYDTMSISLYLDPWPAIMGRTYTNAADSDSVIVDRSYTSTLHATDIGGGSLKFTFVDSVPGMTLTDSTLSWTPVLANKGLHKITVKITDMRGGGDTLTWRVYVADILFEQVTASAPFGPRTGMSLTAWNGKLWLIGGVDQNGGLKSDVWNSSDGVTWSQVRDSAGFTPRERHRTVVFNNKLWVIAGFRRGSVGLRDVWYSSDGANWLQVTSSAGFGARGAHTSLVFQNKMWVIAGAGNSSYSDVWSSSDGMTWDQATNNGVFGPRYDHASLVFDEKIWLVGGLTGTGEKNDIWNSPDGINWNIATSGAQFSPMYSFGLVDFQNQTWIMGLGPIWHSMDGFTWTEGTYPAYEGRLYSAYEVFDGRIWMIGGGSSTVRLGDIWRSK